MLKGSKLEKKAMVMMKRMKTKMLRLRLTKAPIKPKHLKSQCKKKR